MYSVVFEYEQGNMNSVQNEGGKQYGILVSFEGVYYDYHGDEKVDDDDARDHIGNVDVNGDGDDSDYNDNDDNDDHDEDDVITLW